MNKLFFGLMMTVFALTPLASQAAVTTDFSPGDLIKGSGSTVYYFAQDGRRYVFPNEKTYFTWYKDFSTVKQIPDGMLGTLALASTNVTYRPGVKMVKVATDPRVYVVDQGGVLRLVISEQQAETLYGLSWKTATEDVPDAFFTNYRIGNKLTTAADFKPKDVMTQTTTIAQDKYLDPKKATVTIGSVNNGFVPPTMTVKRGTTVSWTNNDNDPHSVVAPWGSSGSLKYQTTFSHTFNHIGSFDYHDAAYKSIKGTINVIK